MKLTKIGAGIAEEITWQENTLGSKLVGQGSRGPMDLDWPAVLRDDRWASYRHEIDAARDQVVKELTSSGHVTSESDHRLRDAVQKLNVDFAQYWTAWIRNDAHGGNWGWNTTESVAARNTSRAVIMPVNSSSS